MSIKIKPTYHPPTPETYIPEVGEAIICVDPSPTGSDKERYKIEDGVTTIKNLPYYNGVQAVYNTELLEFKAECKKSYIEKKLNSMKTIHRDKSVIGIVFADEYIRDIGNLMCERFPIDFSVVINMDTQTVHLRTIKENFSVCVLAKAHGGGGRTNVASFVLNDSTVNLFIDEIFKS